MLIISMRFFMLILGKFSGLYLKIGFNRVFIINGGVFMWIILIVLAIIFLLLIYFVSAQRRFVHLDELSENALSQIGVQQTSRWDALTQLVKTVKAYTEHEYNLLIETISRRNTNKVPQTPEEVESDDTAFRQTFSQFSAVAENYPDMKSGALFQDLMGSVNEYENKVRMSRMVYNDTVTKWNRLTKQIPTNLVASILGYRSRTYLEVPEEKTGLPEMEF